MSSRAVRERLDRRGGSRPAAAVFAGINCYPAGSFFSTTTLRSRTRAQQDFLVKHFPTELHGCLLDELKSKFEY